MIFQSQKEFLKNDIQQKSFKHLNEVGSWSKILVIFRLFVAAVLCTQKLFSFLSVPLSSSIHKNYKI